MPHKSNQKGFAAVEGLLILIIIAALVGVGVYVWQAQKQTTATLDSASKVAQSSPEKVAKKPTPVNATKYLTIKEWGVKLPINGDISDAYYIQKSGIKGVSYLSLGQYKGTDCAADDVSLGALLQFSATDKDDAGNTMLSDFPSAVKVDDEYYAFESPQAACSGAKSDNTADFGQAGAEKAANFMKELKAAAGGIVAS